jgi:hypothetical protein
VEALIFPACYQLNAELGILLDARTCPARIIATHHESRTPTITYFQLRGAGAIVEEIPERVENGHRHRPESAGVIFSYRLLTPAFAAGELARWAMKPIPVGRYQPRPPVVISPDHGRRDDCHGGQSCGR